MGESSILVIGASRGIGKATVRCLLEEGHSVCAVARDESGLGRLRTLVGDQSRLRCYQADCSNPQEVGLLAERLASLESLFSGLVLCIGDGRGSVSGIPTEEEFVSSWTINFSSALYSLRSFVSLLDPERSSVVYVSSIAGVEDVGAPTEYALSKAAATVAVQSLARRLAPGVRLNVVAPGNTLVEGGRWEQRLIEDRAAVEEMIRRDVPLQRFGTPSEIAEAIRFLISPRSSFITGQVLRVDGGQTRAFL